MAVARCTPIASRRQRSAGSHLRRVGQRRALELTRLEESPDEDRQPPLDRGAVVLAPLGLGHVLRPAPARAIAPRVFGEEYDAARSIPEPADVIQKKILQLERPDDRLAGLLRLGGALFTRDQLR